MILNGYRYKYEKRLIYKSSLNIKVGVFVAFAVLVDSLLQLWSGDKEGGGDIKVGGYQGPIQ